MKPKLFYGWYIVMAGMTMALFNSFIFGYGWSAFLNPIIATFGWTMAQISLASSLRGIETGIFNPMWGVAVDRWSPRKLMLFGVVCTASGMFLLSQTRNLAMYYGGFVIVGIGGSLVNGILPLTLVARWFRKDIGKANGLFFMGGVSGGVLVPVVVKTVDRFGWQTTLLYASIIFLAVGIPLSFVMRSRPSEYGLLPDGKAADTTGGGKHFQGPDFGTSVRDALRMRAFWHIIVVDLFQNATMSTVMLYGIPYLTNLGMDRARAGTVISLYTVISLCGRLPAGVLADVFKKSYVVAASVALQGIGIFVFWLMGASSPFWFILLFAATYGIAISGVMPLRAPLLSEYFGTRNFGTIFGLTSVFITMAGVVSQPLAGWIYDTQHAYKIWWLALAGFSVIALISILTIPAPERRPVPVAAQAVPVRPNK